MTEVSGLHEADIVGQVRRCLLEENFHGSIDLNICERLLERSIELASITAEAWVRVLRGVLLTRSSELPRAASDLVQACLIFAELGDPEGHVIALWRKGSIWCRVGDLDNGRLILSQGLELARNNDLRLYEGILLANLAFTWGSEGHAEQYKVLSEQALAVFTELDEEVRQAHVLCNLGGALARLGQLDEAEDAYLRAEKVVDPSRHFLMHALIEGGRGELAFLRHDVPRGMERTIYASEYLRENGLLYDALRQDALRAKGLLDSGHPTSVEVHRTIVAEARDKGFRALELQALLGLAQGLSEADQHEAAYKTLKEAWDIRSESIREESRQRFAVLKDASMGSAIAQDRLRANELAHINQGLRDALRERDELNEALKELARKDPLTDVLNRHGFEEATRPLLEQMSNSKGMAILWVDVDQFKMINDTWGHSVGDEVLIMIARRLTEEVRNMDVVSRFGGDEFVVLLVDIDEVEAVWVSDQIKRRVEKDPFLSSLGPVKVGISVGMSAVEDAVGLEKAMHRADTYMYQEKRGTGSWHAVDPDTLTFVYDLEESSAG